MKAAWLKALFLFLGAMFLFLPTTARAVVLTGQPATIYYTTNGADPIAIPAGGAIPNDSGLIQPFGPNSLSSNTITWNGAGADNLASNPVNWAGNVTPANNDYPQFNSTTSKDSTWDLYIVPATISFDLGYTGTVTLNSVLALTGNITIAGGKLTIKGILEIGCGSGSSPPSAPTSLNATPASSSAMDLFWSDNSSNEAGFKIERKTGTGDTYNLIAVVGASATTFSDTGLNAGITYYYRVRAYNSSGDSTNSNEAYAATPIPPTVTTNAATAINGTSAAVNATINPNGAETTVHFEWGPTTSYGNNTSSHSAGSGMSDVTASDSLTGLSVGTTYHYRIVASNAGGTTSGSDLTFTTSSITLSIDSPSDSATISRPDVMVKGTVTNPDGYETGVTVNGVIANVSGNQFAANHVPLQEGVNVITATATDASGNTSTATVTVTAATTGKYIRLTADTTSGIAPLATTLHIDGSFSIANSTLTATGPVQPEIVTVSADQYQVSMTAEGIYYLTATVTGSDQNQYQDTLAVVALNSTTIDTLLRSKWTAMATSLGNQNITTALTYISPATRTIYQEMFTAIYDQLPTMVATQTGLDMISVGEKAAVYKLKTLENGGAYAYQVTFVKDTNGLWVIQDY